MKLLPVNLFCEAYDKNERFDIVLLTSSGKGGGG